MSDARLVSPAAERNLAPIADVLAERLPAKGLILELASGSGQHAAALAARFPALEWQPSDRDPDALTSIEAYRAEADCANLRPAMEIDLIRPLWWQDVSLMPAAMLAINVTHVAPWSVTKSLLDAAEGLLTDGPFFIYGPFMRDGRHTSDGNAAFDRSLKQRNVAWGLRDLADIAIAAQERRLRLAEIVPMPANNFFLVIRKTADASGKTPAEEIY